MTRNDLEVSAKRLANDAEQLRGRQRSIMKLGGGILRDRWKAEYEALEEAVRGIDRSVNRLRSKAGGNQS